MNHDTPFKVSDESARMEDDETDNFDILVCTCVAFVATTLIVVGQMMNEGDLRAVVVIGGCMLSTNVLMTRHHYHRLCRDALASENLPLTHAEPAKSPGQLQFDAVADKSNPTQFIDSTRPHRRNHHHHRQHPRRDTDVQDSNATGLRDARFQKSPSHRKLVRKVRRKRKKESAIRQGGLAGLGNAHRTVCI